MQNEKTRIIIVEDDELIRNGFANFINEDKSMFCVNHYGSCESAIKNINRDLPDIILMDIELPGMSGIEGIKIIKKMHPKISIIAVTVHENEQIVFDALCAGASGYLTKNISPQKLIEAIKETIEGGASMSTNIAKLVIGSFHKNYKSPLTPRETEVLNALSKGKTYTMVANELHINKETVRSHIKNIYMKLEVNSKAEAIEVAVQNKLI